MDHIYFFKKKVVYAPQNRPILIFNRTLEKDGFKLSKMQSINIKRTTQVIPRVFGLRPQTNNYKWTVDTNGQTNKQLIHIEKGTMHIKTGEWDKQADGESQ